MLTHFCAQRFLQMYKLVFIDIDGTLLTSEHKISKGTLLAIKRIGEINKIPVILTTARPPMGVKKIYAALNLDSPVVCFNGALILDQYFKKEFSYLLAYTIDLSLLNDISEIAIKNNVSINFYEKDKWTCNKHDQWVKQEEKITGIKAAISSYALLLDRWIRENRGPNKILFMGEQEEIDKVELLLNKYAHSNFNVYKSKPTYLEITNISASKKSAMDFLLGRYGLTNKEVIAIGDSYNDIDMIRYAGVGIAMGNAPDEVKAGADFITLDNDADGIQLALDKFIE